MYVFIGHFVPQLAIVLLNHNKHSTGLKFNIKGVAVSKAVKLCRGEIPNVAIFH